MFMFGLCIYLNGITIFISNTGLKSQDFRHWYTFSRIVISGIFNVSKSIRSTLIFSF